MNTYNNKETIKTPSQDGQGHWYELCSQAQALNPRENLNNNTMQRNKKKKSHGNRKEQHRRRRLRRQQQKINNDNNNPNPNIESGIQIQEQRKNSQSQTKSKEKRKRQDTHKDTRHVNRSLSQLSLSQERNVKKIKTTTTTATSGDNPSASAPSTSMNANNNNNQETVDPEENDASSPANCVQTFKPKYLKVSDKIFKEMISNAVPDGDKIVRCLDTKEKLQFVREMTEITNNLEYFGLQRNLWKYYYDIGMKENIWTSQSSNLNTAEQPTSYFFPKDLIEKRRQTITHQIHRTITELRRYISNLQRNAQQWQPLVDVDLLSTAITECVKKGQQRLRQEFQYKEEISKLDLKDRLCITKFYNLKPNETQVTLTKKYWQTVANEQRTTEEIEKLRKRIYLQRLPSKFNKMVDQSAGHSLSMLSSSVLDKDQRARLTSSYSKAITQHKFDLMSINLNTMEHIRRGHQELLVDLQKQISQSCNEPLQQAIKNRQQTMGKRHDKFLKHTLNTFFDEAPTAAAAAAEANE